MKQVYWEVLKKCEDLRHVVLSKHYRLFSHPTNYITELQSYTLFGLIGFVVKTQSAVCLYQP